MHIFIDDTIFEKQRAGGISRYFCELITALSKIPDVEIVLYVGQSSNVYLHSLESLPSVRLVRFRNRCRLPKQVFALCNSMRRKWCFAGYYSKTEPAIYHPSYYFVDQFIAKRASATVITVHDLIYETLNDDFRPSKIKKRLAIQNQADLILTVSESTARDLTNFNPSVADRIDVTELAAAALDANALTTNEQLPESFFLFVGQRKDYKQGELALRSFHELRTSGNTRLQLLFVGGGSFKSKELSLIEELGLTDHVTQINLSDAELHDAYTKAAALLFPSDYEGFGLPVLEAIHHGCPVIAQAVSSIPSVGGEWPVYFDASESGSLTRAMAWVYAEGRAQIANDRALARTHQMEQFSWQKTATKTHAAYQKTLDSAKPHRSAD